MNDFSIIAELKAVALGEAKKAAIGSSGRGVKGNTALSRALNDEITPQAISQWKQVPSERVLDVERATGISRHRLRPDLYPEPVVSEPERSPS
jgi:hypothetical protein